MSLSEHCIELYSSQYPDDHCGFQVPGYYFKIEHEETMYIQPETETDESFVDRLERSKKKRRNLFYEEWKSFEYDNENVY